MNVAEVRAVYTSGIELIRKIEQIDINIKYLFFTNLPILSEYNDAKDEVNSYADFNDCEIISYDESKCLLRAVGTLAVIKSILKQMEV